jgi:hypothetical protein
MLFDLTAGKRHLAFERFGLFMGVCCCASCRDCRPTHVGEIIICHEPKQCKNLCSSKSTYISSHPVRKQKFEPLSSRTRVAVLLMLPIIISLGGRGVIAKCKDDARQTRR